MVVITRVLCYAQRSPRKYLQKGIIDSLRIHVKGGVGGSGLPRYGGLGGSGGNVFVSARSDMTLEQLKKKLKTKKLYAEPGAESSSKGIIGMPGKDLIVDVPVGITVYDQNGVVIGEVNKEGEQLLVAKGGIGGNADTGYCGMKGQSQAILLDLKLIADVGLVGFPNAGKSTFLNTISKARPKIASYPFTTLRPQIGVINYKDHREITVADLPGLIEGAHVNIGMGHRFLKHVERTKLLLFIVDIQGFHLSPQHVHRSCLETILLLNKEIELYKSDLLNMPSILIINKMDTKNAENMYKELEPQLQDLTKFAKQCDESMQPEQIVKFDDIIPTSLISKNVEQIRRIADVIRNIIDKYEEKKYFGNEGSVNKQFHEKLKRQVQEQHAPNLV